MARMYSRKRERQGKNNNSKSCHYPRLIEGYFGLLEQREEWFFNESLKSGPEGPRRTQRNGRYDRIGTRVRRAETSVEEGVTVAARRVDGDGDVE